MHLRTLFLKEIISIERNNRDEMVVFLITVVVKSAIFSSKDALEVKNEDDLCNKKNLYDFSEHYDQIPSCI